MNFFQTLETQFPDADLTIRIKSKGGILSISVLPVSTEENDIQPLIVSGAPCELDEQFFDLIKKPIEETITAIVNLEEQGKSVKASAEKPAPAPAKKSAEPAKKDAKKTPAKKEIPAPVEGSLFEEPEENTPGSPAADTDDSDDDDQSNEE